MKLPNQNGFTVFEFLFIVLVFSLMGAIGYLSYQNSQDQSDHALYTQFLSVGSAKANSLAQSKNTVEYVKERVERIYQSYQGNVLKLSSVDNGAAIYDQAMLARPYAQVVEKTKADDAFWCGDPVVPGRVEVSNVKLNGIRASATAKHATSGVLSSSWQISLVEYKNDWAIDKVTCP